MKFRIPEVFAYVNNHLIKKQPNYYDLYGIRKFGYWLGDAKKKTHQELEELMMAGSAKGLIKAFNKLDIPASLFVIFTSGGIDFVGGYSYYQFLKNNLFQGDQSSLVQSKLGAITLSESNGDEIHEKLF